METDVLNIVTLCDNGRTPAQIAKQLGFGLTKVYETLREYRPERSRAPRPCTSELVPKIRGMLKHGHKPARVAELCDVSRAYVYRIMQQL